jgi:hypothetical protein
MFRIELFCQDNKLANVLHALTGLAVGAPAVQPVVNAAEKNGKVVANGDGSLDDLFRQYVEEHGIREFNAARMKEFCKASGRSVQAYGYYLKQLAAHGVLKKHGSGKTMRYTVK